MGIKKESRFEANVDIVRCKCSSFVQTTTLAGLIVSHVGVVRFDMVGPLSCMYLLPVRICIMELSFQAFIATT
jgi:hypothetical protein